MKKCRLMGVLLMAVLMGCAAANPFADNLRDVCTAVFTLPDAQVHEAVTRAKQPDAAQEITQTGDPSDISQNIRSKIAPACSDAGVESVVSKWYTFGSLCAGTDWTTQVTAFTSEKTGENTRSFSLTMTYSHPDGEKGEVSLRGKARCDKAGKVEYWALDGDSELTLAQLRERLSEREEK
ncbi:MAG: hypothetical protein PHD32_04635 [Eubacteriales bacterium]|nr:hypothetical protein [Eubacteriales bacterium]